MLLMLTDIRSMYQKLQVECLRVEGLEDCTEANRKGNREQLYITV